MVHRIYSDLALWYPLQLQANNVVITLKLAWSFCQYNIAESGGQICSSMWKENHISNTGYFWKEFATTTRVSILCRSPKVTFINQNTWRQQINSALWIVIIDIFNRKFQALLTNENKNLEPSPSLWYNNSEVYVVEKNVLLTQGPTIPE